MGKAHSWSGAIRNHTDGTDRTVAGSTEQPNTEQGKAQVADAVRAQFRENGQRVTPYDIQIHG
jgi:hypothetical protein